MNTGKFVFCVLTIILCSLFTETTFAMAMDETDASILYVKPGGTGDCSSWEQACELQTALYNAVLGDQIWVAAGTYKPTTSSNRLASFGLKSGVAIYGGFPVEGGDWSSRDWETNTITLSGDIGIEGDNSDNSYHVISASNIDNTAVLDGFTVNAGNALDESYNSHGGGMNFSSSSPTIRNIKLTNNIADFGGGMHNLQSSPTLTNVTFSGNTARYTGGGMANNNSSPTLTNVTFSSNTASIITGYGGGMWNYNNSNAILENVTFSSNHANSYGGGMYNESSSPSLTNVTFSGNTAAQGGGVYNYISNPTLTNVTFSNNITPQEGGGMRIQSSSHPTLTNVTFSGNTAGTAGGGLATYYSNATLTNVTFSNNTASSFGGGGLLIEYCSPILTNVTFSGNKTEGSGGGIYNNYGDPTLTNISIVNNTASSSGGGIYSNSEFTVINSILWGNTPNQVVGGTPSITYSDIQGGGFSGEGNINADPLLGPLQDNGGFTQTHALLSGSPAIDAGNPDNCPSHDQRGYLRPIDGNGDGIAHCDMGAYEYGEFLLPHIFLPLIQR